MADSTLDAIRKKVRRLTRTPSTAQLSNAEVDEYINTFILYDFPAQLRLFSLRTVLTFFTQPGVDVYETKVAPTPTTDPLFNFKNRYIAVHPPVFMAGVPAFYTQQRDVFYGYWPQTNTILDTQLRGTGGVGPFSTTIINPGNNLPFILQRSVNINCIDAAGTAMIMVDVPISNEIGNLTQANVPLVPPFDTVIDPTNFINYTTGSFIVTFPGLTELAAPIMFEGILYQPGKPQSMLYYDNKFTIRPVPDKVYAVQIEADARPTELLADNQSPDLEQWWQYIAIGSARKYLQDRMDMDSVQLIDPEFKTQERLVLRTTLTQQANERGQTIYSQGKQIGLGWFTGGWPY
jgi:hypothetical protein